MSLVFKDLNDAIVKQNVNQIDKLVNLLINFLVLNVIVTYHGKISLITN